MIMIGKSLIVRVCFCFMKILMLCILLKCYVLGVKNECRVMKSTLKRIRSG